jgi:hypothetical protein
MEDYMTVFNYIKDTPVYGQFMLWHLILFMTLGPTLTWQMLIVLLIVFGRSVFGMFKNALKAEEP